MTVTTSYNWLHVNYLTDFASSGNPDVASLASGSFAIAYDFGASTFGNTDTTFFNTPGLNASLAQLSNGNLVIANEQAGDIFFKVIASNGTAVVAQTNVSVNGGGITSSNADVVALSGGGFWIVEQTDFPNAGGDPDHDIVVYRRNSDGSAAGSFVVDNTLADDTGVSVAQLDNGNVAIAWTRTVGTSTQAWSAVYTAAGAVVKAPAAFGTDGTINRNVHITAMDGGFAVVYEDNGWGNPTVDISITTFNSAGVAQATRNVSNPLPPSTDFSNDANPTVTRMPSGFLAVAYSNNFHTDTDTIISLFDVSTGLVVVNNVVTSILSTLDDAESPAIARVGLGGIAVLQHDVTAGSVNGERQEVQRTTVGDNFDNVINGDDFIDVIIGYGGDNTLNGFGNNDLIYGGVNHDLINGGDGNDTLQGYNSSDTINGGNGNDVIYAMVNGNEDGDTFGDVMHGNNDSDTITGSAGADMVYGDQGTDTLHGGGGNDTLTGGTEADTVDGGAGIDTASYAAASGAVTVILTELVAGHTGGASSGADGTDTLIDIENITGSGFGDSLSGNSLVNVLVGGLGSDTIYGGGDKDTLLMDDYSAPAATGGADTGYGGAGDDLLWGYGGSDNLYGGADNDALVGNDFGVAVIGTDGLYGGAGNDTLFVGAGGNAYMDGGTGNDIFYGGLLNDQLRGQTGNDYLYGNAGSDNFLFYSFDFAANDADIVYFIDAGDKLKFSASMQAGGLFFQNLTNLQYDSNPLHTTTGVYITAFLAGGQTAHITVYGTTVATLASHVEYTL